MAPSTLSHAAHSSTNSDDDTRANTLAPKNRACPFCNQLFTSSSLGRHLDLYIKEKNPKAPDGIHDVDQIRKIRSQITRRHARSSTGKRNDSERALSTASVSDAPDTVSKPDTPHLVQAPPQAPSLLPPRFAQTGFAHPPAPSQSGALDLHRLKWQATGVINDLPPRSADSPRLDIFRDSEQRQRYIEERDNGRAAEMALREVLSEVQAAQLRLRNAPLFEDFDFFACNFPSLCFKLLSPPPTLYSTTPMSTTDTWPIDGLPDQRAFEAVKKALSVKVSDYHRLHQTPASSPPTTLQPATREETQGYLDHLNLVWSQWSALSTQDPNIGDKWKLELLRAAADERRLRQDTRGALEEAQAEIEHLRTQLADQAASIAADANRPGTERALWHKVQRPTFAMLGATVPAHVPSSLAQRLDSSSKWDYHTLVTKWRETLRSGPPPSAFPPPPHHSPTGSGVHAAEQQHTQQTNGSGTAAIHDNNLEYNRDSNKETAGAGFAGSSIPSKRGIADTGVMDPQQYHNSRPAPTLRDHYSLMEDQANGRRASPAKR